MLSIEVFGFGFCHLHYFNIANDEATVLNDIDNFAHIMIAVGFYHRKSSKD